MTKFNKGKQPDIVNIKQDNEKKKWCVRILAGNEL